MNLVKAVKKFLDSEPKCSRKNCKNVGIHPSYKNNSCFYLCDFHNEPNAPKNKLTILQESFNKFIQQYEGNRLHFVEENNVHYGIITPYYNSKFVAGARKLQGFWNGKFWTFNMDQKKDAQELYMNCFTGPIQSIEKERIYREMDTEEEKEYDFEEEIPF